MVLARVLDTNSVFFGQRDTSDAMAIFHSLVML